MHRQLAPNIAIFFEEDVERLLSKAQDELKQVITENKHKPLLLLCSGGSALSLLETDFSKVLTGDAADITIGVLDERFSKNPEENNYAQLMQTRFFKQATAAGAKVIDTRVLAGETPEDLAERYQQALKSWLEKYPSGFVAITQGMGGDNHTSGMMCFQNDPMTFERLFQSGRLVVAYDAGDKDARGLSQRVTTTMTFFKHVAYSLLWVVGENKKEALQVLRNQDQRKNVSAAPVRIIFNLPRVSLFTDQQF